MNPSCLLSLVLLAIGTSAGSVVWKDEKSGCQYKDYGWKKFIDCDGLYLEEMPNIELPKEYRDQVLDEIDMSYNDLEYIGPNDFKGLPKARIINLDHNFIHKMSEDAFDGLDSVTTTLNLGHNRFDSFPFGIFHLKSLKNLNLNFNNISYNATDDHALTNEPILKLDSLRMKNNPLDRFWNNWKFGNDLKYLDLSGTSMRTPPLKIQYFTKLEFLDFSFHTFTWSGMVTRAFSKLKNLKDLFLRDVGLTKIPAFDIEGLQRLSLEFNKIETIEKYMFKGMPNLEQLSLDANPIKVIGSDALSPMRMSLRSLSLVNCKFPKAPSVLRPLQKLRELYLANNGINNLEEYNLGNLKTLTYMYLDENNFTAIPTGIHLLRSLKVLSMVENQIRKIKRGAFDDMNNLKEVHVAENKLRMIDGHVFFNLEQEIFINAIHNKINTIDICLIKSSVEYVLLYENPVKCDCGAYWVMKAGMIAESFLRCASGKGMKGMQFSEMVTYVEKNGLCTEEERAEELSYCV